jgi:ribonuclease BN (tRNA processing enzyme)
VTDVDAILVTHIHPDHFADLYGLYYARRFHPRGPQQVALYGPSGFFAFASQLISSDDEFGELCRFEPVKAGQVLRLGPLTVSLFAANHPVETLACRVECDGRAMTYTADSAPSPNLVHAARDADVLLADATWLERQRPLPADVHMTGHEAGNLAAEAGVGRLIVTHVYPSNDPQEVVVEAAGAFDGDVIAAYDLLEVAV